MIDATAAIASPTSSATAALTNRSATDTTRFAKTLKQASANKIDQTPLREVAGQLVSAAFVLPMLAEVRNSSMNTDLFGGGFGQDAIQQQLDTKLADQIASSPRFPLVQSLVDYLSPKRPSTMPAPPAFQQRQADRLMNSSPPATDATPTTHTKPGIDRLG